MSWWIALAAAQDPVCTSTPLVFDGEVPLDATAVAQLEVEAFPEPTPEAAEARSGIRTDGLLIVQGGHVVYERYANGYDAGTRHLMWSATKTFTNALVGVAVQRGDLAVEDSICDHLDLEVHCEVQVRHLLEFSSGLDWRETYEGDPPTTSSVIAMLYGAGRHDMAAYVAATPRRAEPGTTWQYSSGDTNLLAATAQAALGEDAEPWALLFEPAGMDPAWERDEAGTLVGSSYGFATPRDLARFGLLLADDGCVGGERLWPEGWVERSTTPAPSLALASVDRGPHDTNGWQIWLNQPVREQGEGLPPWPSAPPDTFAAMGHWKQAVIVIPSADRVIVRTGDDRDGSFAGDRLMGLSLAVVGHEFEDPGWSPSPGLSADQLQSESREEEVGLLGIGTAYGAKLGCSCAYVMERDEDFCRAWIRASPDIVKVRFDDEHKTVTARALGMKTTSASWRGDREGCTLDP